MSNLLNESIVDAKALRDSALKNAESVVIEKYADEVKKTLETLLEQEEDPFGLEAELGATDEQDLGADNAADEEVVEDQTDDVPLAATDDLSTNEGENLKSLAEEGEDVEVTIDLGALQEAIEALSNEIDEEVEIDSINEEDEVNEYGGHQGRYRDSEAAYDKCKLLALNAGMSPEAAHQKCDKEHPRYVGEEIDVQESFDADSLIAKVLEKLEVDTAADISGWAGRPTSQLKDEQERELAQEASTDSDEDDALEEEQEELNESNAKLEKVIFENNNLKDELANYQSTLEELKENLYEVNLSNARLLYTNRVLRNSSLNERQKDKIVEAISGAGSVSEAKTIFETLQSTMEAKPKRSPKSLSEAIGGRTSVLTASRKETKTSSQDPFSERMRRLAGIK